MKNTMTLIMLAMMSSPLLAENNTNSTSKGFGENCIGSLENSLVKRDQEIKDNQPQAKLGACEKFNVLAIMNGEPMAQSDSSATIDGKVQCKQNGGYTMDYNDCKTVSGLYNGVIMAEQAMFATQKIILAESTIKQNKDIAAAKAKGDLQYGAIEAVIERNKLNKKMYDTQAITYSTAVGALSGGIIGWQKKRSLGKMCDSKKDFETIQGGVSEDLHYIKFSQVECKAIVDEYKNSNIVFQNNGAKATFLGLIGTFLQKANDAKIQAGKSDFVAQRLENSPKSKDIDTNVFDPCMTNANGVACKKNGPRNIKGGTFAGSQNSFGTGSGTNQDFNFDPNGSAGLGSDPLANGTNPEKVGDVSSPFEQAAKDASGILDPAGAASVTPGSQSSAPDGGGGGGGGGGSASLGDDLAGAKAEDTSDPDIKTTKTSGNYKSGKGGFQAVKGGSSGDDANPFASMFDSKGEAGGIEEDRSIASDEGEDSGLFQKISKKYGQVQQDKRLDSENLE